MKNSKPFCIDRIRYNIMVEIISSNLEAMSKNRLIQWKMLFKKRFDLQLFVISHEFFVDFCRSLLPGIFRQNIVQELMIFTKWKNRKFIVWKRRHWKRLVLVIRINSVPFCPIWKFNINEQISCDGKLLDACASSFSVLVGFSPRGCSCSSY